MHPNQVSFFLEHFPAPLHMLIMTRGEPPLPLARLRASGDLCAVRAADLRFSREETAALLQQTVAVPLSPQHNPSAARGQDPDTVTVAQLFAMGWG